MNVPQLQFIDVAVLLPLALVAAGIVLFIKSMQRRENAAESGNPANVAKWHAQAQHWLRRYALAAAALVICLFIAGLFVFSRGAAGP